MTATVLRPIAVVTAGGTREPLDEVRHLTNLATGALPAAMAEQLLARGWQVEYICGPGAVRPGVLHLDLNVRADDWRARLAEAELRAADLHNRLRHGELHLHPIQTAVEMAATLADVCRRAQPAAVVCAAAVADYAPRAQPGKLSSRQGPDGSAAPLTLHLDPTPKAIDGVKVAAPATRLLGFKLLAGAAESELIAAARALSTRAGADMVYANDVRTYKAGQRTGLLLGPQGQELARLDGGTGPQALRHLAELLVHALIFDLDRRGDSENPTAK